MPELRAPSLPEPLEDFPWAEHLYTWEYDPGWRWHRQAGMKFSVWFPPHDFLTTDAKAYWREASRQFEEVWAWVEERHMFTDAPRLELSGSPMFKVGETHCSWRQMMALGTFRFLSNTDSR